MSKGRSTVLLTSTTALPSLRSRLLLTGTGLSGVSVSPNKLSLSSALGNTSTPGTVNVTNNTGSDVTLTYMTSAAFAAGPGATNGCGSSLASSTTCAIAVTFTPGQPGSIYGSLIFTGAVDTQVVNLIGTVTGGISPTLSFSPTELTFAVPQLVGTERPVPRKRWLSRTRSPLR